MLNLGLRDLRRDHHRDRVHLARPRPASYNALNYPDYPVLEGTFLLFSAAVIAANLIADLLLTVFDPRVTARMSDATDRPRPRPAAPAERRHIAWARRRRALAWFWREYRKERAGMIGLAS